MPATNFVHVVHTRAHGPWSAETEVIVRRDPLGPVSGADGRRSPKRNSGAGVGGGVQGWLGPSSIKGGRGGLPEEYNARLDEYIRWVFRPYANESPAQRQARERKRDADAKLRRDAAAEFGALTANMELDGVSLPARHVSAHRALIGQLVSPQPSTSTTAEIRKKLPRWQNEATEFFYPSVYPFKRKAPRSEWVDRVAGTSAGGGEMELYAYWLYKLSGQGKRGGLGMAELREYFARSLVASEPADCRSGEREWRRSLGSSPKYSSPSGALGALRVAVNDGWVAAGEPSATAKTILELYHEDDGGRAILRERSIESLSRALAKVGVIVGEWRYKEWNKQYRLYLGSEVDNKKKRDGLRQRIDEADEWEHFNERHATQSYYGGNLSAYIDSYLKTCKRRGATPQWAAKKLVLDLETVKRFWPR